MECTGKGCSEATCLGAAHGLGIVAVSPPSGAAVKSREGRPWRRASASTRAPVGIPGGEICSGAAMMAGNDGSRALLTTGARRRRLAAELAESILGLVLRCVACSCACCSMPWNRLLMSARTSGVIGSSGAGGCAALAARACRVGNPSRGSADGAAGSLGGGLPCPRASSAGAEGAGLTLCAASSLVDSLGFTCLGAGPVLCNVAVNTPSAAAAEAEGRAGV